VLIFVVGLLVTGFIACFLYYFRTDLGLVRQKAATPEGPSQAGLSTIPATPGSESAQTIWLIVDRVTDGFTVEMPGTISEFQVPAYNEWGGVEPVEMIQATPSSDITFAVTWADNPPVERVASENIDRTLDMARNGALARTRTILTDESQHVLGVYTARDFSGRNDTGGILRARLLLAGRRLYMLIATFPAPSVQHDEDVNHFFNSFTLTSAPNRN
jgi:hypothetical protein